MEKGVKGFRFDVINLISKAGFEDDFSVDGDGRSFYTDGLRIHEFLQELARDSFAKDKDIITVGEMSSTTMENCYKYAGEKTGELSMVFTFHHLKVDFMGNEKWVLVPTDFMKLKQLIFDWQINMEKNNAWNAVFWCNHDQPRVISRFGSDDKYHKESGKMLATLIHCLRGTPYIYQGEEIGMTNAYYQSMTQYRDVDALNKYEVFKQNYDEETIIAYFGKRSRDNARMPIPWDNSRFGGFSIVQPWLAPSQKYTNITVENALKDPNSVYYFYRDLLRLRKEYEVLIYGDYQQLLKEHLQVYAYRRTLNEQQVIVICNYSKDEVEIDLEFIQGTLLISNYEDDLKQILRSYEAKAYLAGK